MTIRVSMDRFEQLVEEALGILPADLARLMDNVVVFVDDSHPEDLLGLYEGIPLTERGDYGYGELPDTVTIYRQGICAVCRDEAQVIEEVAVTVVHELAHHFGIDDERLTELGWD